MFYKKRHTGWPTKGQVSRFINECISSVTSRDRFPKLSAEKSLSFVSSIFKPLVVIWTWPPVPRKASALHQACKEGKSTVEFPELLFASRSCTLAPNSSNWKSHVALVLCRPWPLGWAGPTIQPACLSRVECSSPHREGDYVSIGDLSSVAMSTSVSPSESLFSGSITQSVFVLLK